MWPGEGLRSCISNQHLGAPGVAGALLTQGSEDRRRARHHRHEDRSTCWGGGVAGGMSEVSSSTYGRWTRGSLFLDVPRKEKRSPAIACMLATTPHRVRAKSPPWRGARGRAPVCSSLFHFLSVELIRKFSLLSQNTTAPHPHPGASTHFFLLCV